MLAIRTHGLTRGKSHRPQSRKEIKRMCIVAAAALSSLVVMMQLCGCKHVMEAVDRHGDYFYLTKRGREGQPLPPPPGVRPDNFPLCNGRGSAIVLPLSSDGNRVPETESKEVEKI